MSAHRTQLDDHTAISESTWVSFDPAEDITRQEFKEETDVAYILSRYGLPTPTGRYGEYDDSVNLQEAIRLRGELDAAFSRLPERLRRDYGSWGAIIAAADRGELQASDLKEVDDQQNEALKPKEEQ